MDQNPPLMTVAQVAAAMQVHRQTAYAWVRKGLLPAARLPGGKDWRVRRADLEVFMSRMFADREPQPVESGVRPRQPRDWFAAGSTTGQK